MRDPVERLWTYEDLAARWGRTEGDPLSVRHVKRLVDQMRIPKVQLGHRTVRFRPVAVMKAEERAETGYRHDTGVLFGG